jgi:hypothetical protein
MKYGNIFDQVVSTEYLVRRHGLRSAFDSVTRETTVKGIDRDSETASLGHRLVGLQLWTVPYSRFLGRR